jgi:hypothetical protein
MGLYALNQFRPHEQLRFVSSPYTLAVLVVFNCLRRILCILANIRTKIL